MAGTRTTTVTASSPTNSASTITLKRYIIPPFISALSYLDFLHPYLLALFSFALIFSVPSTHRLQHFDVIHLQLGSFPPHTHKPISLACLPVSDSRLPPLYGFTVLVPVPRPHDAALSNSMHHVLVPNPQASLQNHHLLFITFDGRPHRPTLRAVISSPRGELACFPSLPSDPHHHPVLRLSAMQPVPLSPPPSYDTLSSLSNAAGQSSSEAEPDEGHGPDRTDEAHRDLDASSPVAASSRPVLLTRITSSVSDELHEEEFTDEVRP